MGDSRPEGERNFWNGREAVTARPQNIQVFKICKCFTLPSCLHACSSSFLPFKCFFFLQKVNQLQNEGGSDVFTSNRHSPLRQSDTAHRYKNNVVAVN
jgi:hypothetical protein